MWSGVSFIQQFGQQSIITKDSLGEASLSSHSKASVQEKQVENLDGSKILLQCIRLPSWIRHTPVFGRSCEILIP